MHLSSAATEEEKYYYAFEERVPLVEKENTLLVKFADGVDKTKARELIKIGISSGYKEKWHNAHTVEIAVDSKKTINALKTKLKFNKEVYTCQPFYTLKDGLDMGVSDEILIRFLPETTDEQKMGLIKTYDLELVKTTKIYQKLKVKKGADALEIANKIYESGLMEFSTPGFISYPELHQVIPNDNYFGNQITCNNTGQTFTDGHSGTNDADIDAPEAWEITNGCSDIVVAVLDEGVTFNHPDLPNSRQVRLNGSNFADGNANDPSPTGNMNHGNACAGVIAATMNNNQGIAGIAPECKIMPIRIFNSDGSGILPESVASAIQFAVDNGANILSNSWGYKTSDQNAHPIIKTAINYALSHNCVVIFSAGNTARHSSCDDNGYVEFPANVNISGVITVGASDRNDNQSDYSPTNSLIDIVAPSHRAYPPEVYYPYCGGINGETLEMWSIDIPENTGYNPYPADADTHPPTTGEILPNNLAYTARFGGTSHSCPVVAGVAALMLSVDPDLSYMDVFDILTSTADKVGGHTYTNGKCNEMGYGRVNAHAALLETIDQMNFTISGPSLICTSGTFTVNNPPGTTVSWNESSNLTENPTGTFSANGSGSGWVQPTFTSDCGYITLPRNPVWVGAPQIASINGPTSTPNNNWAYYTPVLESELSSATDYEWILNPINGNSVYDYGNYCDIAFYNPGSYQLLVRAKNNCSDPNFGPYYGTGIYVYETYSMMVSPNPATTEAIISIVPSSFEDATLKSASTETTLDENTEWDIEVYDSMQSLKLKKQKLKGSSSRINTQSWKEGVYMVRVKYNDELLTGKLIVKK